jgi:heterodisulfide reductase subunit A
LNLNHKHVTIIGAGVTGLTAADLLAGWGAHVSLIEKTPFLGGHAIQLNCKATDTCVKCGACVVEDRLLQATRRTNVEIIPAHRLKPFPVNPPFKLSIAPILRW